MFQPPSRRDVLRASGGLGLLALAGCRSSMTDSGTDWFDVSLAQWSNHRSLKAGEQSNLEWITNARTRYDLGAVEFVNSFFKDKARDEAYLDQMKQRAADADVRMLLIMIDEEGSLAHQDDGHRSSAIENHKRWIEAAGHLGCHSIRVNAAGGGDAQEMMQRAADSLVQLADHGDPYGVSVIVENHGGRSSNGAWLAGVMRTADDPRVGTLPDFGNFDLGGGEQYDRYLGVTELMPFAKAVSAKSHDFDEAGDEVNTDFRRMLGIVKAAGYRGYIGIEFEGDRHSEDEGILLTRDLLTRIRAELA